MNILIELIQIPFKKVGVGIYAINLITEIYKIDNKNRYYILIQDDESSLDYIQDERFKIIKVKSRLFRNPFLLIFLEQFYIPYLALRYKIDIMHSMHHSFPLLAITKKVVVVHDVIFLKHPGYHLPSRKYYFGLFDFLASVFADRIITDSKASLTDFLELFPYASKKSSVIYLGKSNLFRPDLDSAKVENIKNKYKTGNQYLLFIGTLEPRKNIKNLILAFHKVSQEIADYKLVITGRKGWHYEKILLLPEQLNLKEKVIFTDYIDEEDKPFLIAGAKIFIYPSLYEGFGIPVLEALACGVPTITSNISSLPEVAGDAALLVEPSSVEELYLGIKKLLNDKVLYAQLKQKAIQQAKKFDWEKTARQTLNVYNSLS